MRLTDLEPQYLKRIDDAHWRHDATREDADGLMFLCPVCFKANSGPIGTHRVICWRPHVPQTTRPTPGRWEIQGANFDDLSLVAGSSSVALQGGCNAHFFVRGGEIV